MSWSSPLRGIFGSGSRQNGKTDGEHRSRLLRVEPLEIRALLSIRPFVEFDAGVHTDPGSNLPVEFDIAVGPGAILSVDDQMASVADKSPALLESQTWGDFFTGMSVTDVSDPAAMYDTYGDRYLIVVEEVEEGTLNFDGTGGTVRGGYAADEARLLIGVSTSSLMNDLDGGIGDVDDDWHHLAFDAAMDFGGVLAYLDAPQITVDANYLYIVGEYYSFGARDFQGSAITRLSKSELFSGSLSSSWQVKFPGISKGVVPAESVGRAPADPVLFAEADASGTGIRIWELDGSFALTDAGVVPTLFTPFTGGIPQLGSAELLNTESPDLLNAVWRNDSLWSAHPVSHLGDCIIRWHEIDTTGGVYSLTQSGNLDPGTSVHLPQGAISVDADGNMAVANMQSSATLYPSMKIVGRVAGDPLGITSGGISIEIQTEALLAPSEDLGFKGRSTGIALDPWDDSTYWAVQRFHSGDSGWGHVAGFSSLASDRFEANETRLTATDVGVAPGVHLRNLSIHSATDQDWFEIEVLRPDDIEVDVKFQTIYEELQFDVTDSAGVVLQSSAPSSGGATASLAGIAAGTYYVHVSGVAAAENVYSLEITPTSGVSSTTLYYVNDSSSAGDAYTYAPGDDTNDGLSPHAPKASVQSVLTDYDLGPADLVLVDAGSYNAGAVTIETTDEGAAYAGAPAGSEFTYSGDRWDLVDADHNMIYGMSFAGGGGVGVRIQDGVSDASTDNEIRGNNFPGTTTAIWIDQGAGNLLLDNTITGTGSNGVYAQNDASFTWQNGDISGRTNGIYTSGSETLTVQDSEIQATSYGIYVQSGSLTAMGNTIHGASFGIYQNYYGPHTNGLALTGNEISDNDIGVYSRTANTTAYGNVIHDNTTGIEGYGVWGAADWSYPPNDIYNNTTGIKLWDDGEVRFNRIHENATGIEAQNHTALLHNVLYRNTGQSILVDGRYDVAVENNTIYAPAGHGVRVRGGAYDVVLKNNIIWTQAGYGIFVDTESQQGFESDYNNLFSSGTGDLVWWQKPFDDLFDWQVESGLDGHSIGYTTIDPTLDDPQFVNLGGDDYHLSAASTSIDAGDPSSLFPDEPTQNGARINLGAYGNTAEAAASVARYVEVDYPNYYTDWPNAEGRGILWHTYDSTTGTISGSVDIDLIDATTLTKVADIAIVPASDGSYGWSPQASGISPDTLLRYRVLITSVTYAGIDDASREGFSVPETNSTFYVNDDSTTNDEYSVAIGNNRNTGKTAGDPKANLLPVLRSYDLGPGDVVQIDTGEYIHVRNVTISGATGLGDDEGATFTGPNDSGRVAHIDRANPYTGSTNIEINDGDYVTLRNLTLTGAQKGLWVHSDSTYFTGEGLIVSDNSSDGIMIESDSSDAVVDELQAFNNGGTGIRIETPIDTLSNSVAYNNVNHGIYLNQTGGTLLENNAAYNNDIGIYVSNSLAGDPTVIGSSDLSGNGSSATAKGNIVYNNNFVGIYARYNVLTAGNTVYGHNGSGDHGIYLYGSNSKAEQNVVHGNSTGIQVYYGVAENNRVYDNSVEGIYLAYSQASAIGNVVYSNAIGIHAAGSSSQTRIENNLIYDNDDQGILLVGVTNPLIVNNTVYQETGDAVIIQSNSSGVILRNNILWNDSGYDIYVDPSSQLGFVSDYNDLYATGTGQVAYWQGIARPTLQTWQNTAFTDQNSLSQEPLFVDADGADNQLGFDSIGGIDHGVDDDYHVQSAATDGAAPGSYHGGSLSPVLHGTTGLPIAVSGVWTIDAASSPVIDRGDANDDYANEPLPNGSYINLGAYGNTDQASTSPAEYVLVTRPDGGEVWPADQTFPIRWRTEPTVIPGTGAEYSAEVLTDPTAPAPVGYWRLGDSAPSTTAVDATGNGYDGVYTNGPLLNQTGIFTSDDAVSFDGSDDVVLVADDPALRPTDLTVEAWVNPTASIQTYDTVVAKTTSSSWNDGYGLYYHNGDIAFFVNNYSTHRVQAPITIGSFSHVAVSYDGDQLKLYIDGELVDSETVGDPINHSTNSLMIGQGASTSYTWHGLIDEAAVYDQALTQDEISDHVNLGPDGRGLVDIELLDAGTPVHSITTDTANDGAYLWTIPWLDPPASPPIAPGVSYRVKVTRANDVTLTDQSNDPFEITEKKSIYYVNDSDLTGDGYTTAIGNDANDGLSPSTPKASIAAVLSAYSLGPGDVIQVDVGLYNLSLDIALESDDSGVTIVGYTDPGDPSRIAVLDRGNQGSGSYVFKMAGADDVTLDSLVIRNAYSGVHAPSGVDSDGLVITACVIYDHANAAIYLDNTNDDAVIASNEIYDSNHGAYIRSSHDTLIEGNTIRDNTTYGAYFIYDTDSIVRGNTVYNNDWGIYTYQSYNAYIGDGNIVYANRDGGILAQYNDTQVVGNEVFNNNAYGIYVYSGTTVARDNEVHGNVTGIYSYSSLVEDNRIYNNSGAGIDLRNYGASALGNTVYSNSVGIETRYVDYRSRTANNLIYDNLEDGIRLIGGTAPQVINNTIYQAAGDAIHVQDSSSGVQLRNNILWVESGYDIHVDPNSEVGFVSDYNDLYATNSGQLGNWGGQGFSSLVNWRYETGRDMHSQSVDPSFVDRDGPDDILGFSKAQDTGATPLIIDDGDAGFAVDPAPNWASGAAAYNGDSMETTGSAGDSTATWTFTGLDPGAYYEVAATWPVAPTNSYQAPYSVTNGVGSLLMSELRVDQRLAPTGINYSGTDWQPFGYFRPEDSTLEIQLSNYRAYGGATLADAILLRQIEGDHGVDDVFNASSISATIDAGSLTDYYLREPLPNGERINQGFKGNTPEATQSAAQLVQVLSPNGWEKYEDGQGTSIDWRSSGLTQERHAALINVGGIQEDNWLLDDYWTTSHSSTSHTNPIDITGVTNPAPEAVHQAYGYAYSGVGKTMDYSLPVPDGAYTIRLHFAEPSYTSAGSRIFDVLLQGLTVQDDFDVFGASGARYKATTLEFPVTAAGGTGIDLSFVNETYYGAILSGIELRTPNVGGVSDPQVALDLSTDTGSIWTPLSTGESMDVYGRGSLPWTATPQTSGNTALIRASALNGTMPQDESDAAFLIANAGTEYYVATTGDNANSGKSLGDPMASLAALIEAYDLDSGDTIHVEAGTYNVLRNIVLGTEDSGVSIVGPGVGTAILDRGNQAAGSYVFELTGADAITLDTLTIRGAYDGVYAGVNSDSDDLTVTNCVIHGNVDAGVYIRNTNDRAHLELNELYGSNYGIYAYGAIDGMLIEGNTARDNYYYGIFVQSDTNTIIRENTAYNNRWGVYTSSSTNCQVGPGNTVYANQDGGIQARYNNTEIFGNDVFNNNDYGIYVYSGSNVARDNDVHGNERGIYGYSGVLAEGNRVYNNSNIGIDLSGGGASALGNTVYSNSIGIKAVYVNYLSRIENNLIYGNTNHGLQLNGVAAPQVVNNTIHQEVGDAIRMQDSSSGVQLRNNILWVESGYGLFVDLNSEVGIASDYNDLYATNTGQLGNWGGQGFSSLVNWRYETGQDMHSQSVDPSFVDQDGPDDILGFSKILAAGATPLIVDDGDAGFTVDPAPNWASGAAGHAGDSQQTTGTSGDSTATWTFTGLDPGAYYEVAATWPVAPTNTYQAPYAVANGVGALLDTEILVNQRLAPTGINYSGTDWQSIGYFQPEDSTLEIRLSNYSAHGGTTLADAILVRQIEGDRGVDDVYNASSISATIDAGSLSDYYLQEPLPNGERINQGHTGNTANATQSALQFVQVLSPNGGEKYKLGQGTTLDWRSSGLTQERYAVLINVGGAQEDNWLEDDYWTTHYSTSSFVDPVDMTGVTNPAPETVYQTYRYAPYNPGNFISYSLPVPDGTYMIRLHFTDPYYSSPGNRIFDVLLQGAVVQDDFDVAAASGTNYRATTLEFPVTAAGGTGIDLTLLNETYQGAILSAIELRTTNASGVIDPQVALDLSTNTGSAWAPLSAGESMDLYGRGSLAWTATPQTSGNTALIRATALDGTTPQDESDAAFLITNAGTEYYVSTTGDNENSGKSSANPMADLSALIGAYDLDPGDTIHVEAGTYNVLRNIVLGTEDSGVAIVGPGVGTAILDRANQATGSYVFELTGADGVTLDTLTIRGAYDGVYAGVNSDSDDLTVTNCVVHNNVEAGIYLRSTTDKAHIQQNEIYDSNYGVYAYGSSSGIYNTLIEGNTIHDNVYDGIYAYSDDNTIIRDNITYANRWGVYAYYSRNGQIGPGNTIYANRSGGIEVRYDNTQVVSNDVYDNNAYGIHLYAGTSVARDNEVHGNVTGIYGYSGVLVEANRVYNNSGVGIDLYNYGASALSNAVYSNSTGIEAHSVDYRSRLENNLLYGNTNYGLRLLYASAPQVANNTIYQEVGDAIRIQDSSNNVVLKNNILWVEAGYDIYVMANSQTGLDSSNNLFHQGVDPNAHVGFWGNVVQDSLVDWYAASGQDFYTDNSDDTDDLSRVGDPNFVDVNGADNVLGYSTAGLGYNGGNDDNFYLAAGSPAIDRADWWMAPPTDMEGYARIDDPATANLGSLGYLETSMGSSQYAAVGTAKGWRSNNTYWTLNFTGGFTFPFYETAYSSVTVSTEGFLKFAGALSAGDGDNTLEKLRDNRLIAPLWDNIRTNGTGDNIFVDDATPGQVTIRWDATNEVDDSDVQFSVTLFDTGVIQFHYGLDNANLSPTVGISRGGNLRYLVSTYDSQTNLAGVDSMEIALTPGVGYADMGSFEFRGDSNDTAPPQVIATLPGVIETSGLIGAPVTQIKVEFNEEMNPIDANAAANYELREAGLTGFFNDGDDIVYALTPSYVYDLVLGDSITTLDLGIGGTPLPEGIYRLTVKGDLGTSIHDASGNRLDGDRDGTEGPDYLRTFFTAVGPLVSVGVLATIDRTPQLTGTVDDPGSSIQLMVNGHIYAATNNGDGTWTLPDDTIFPPLAGGIYDVQATATDAYSRVGADSTTDELTIIHAVSIQGTGGDDNIRIWPGTPGGSQHRVQINSADSYYDAAIYDTIYIDGLGGDDTLSVYGKAVAENAAFNGMSVHVSEATVYDVHGQGMEDIYFYGGGGADTAQMLGSAGTDNFYANRTYSYLRGNSNAFFNYVRDFATLSVDMTATPGVTDTAYMYDSSGDDILVAGETQATLDYDSLVTPGVDITVVGFDRVDTYAENGGTDTATLTGSAGVDTFIGLPAYSYVNGGAFYNYTKGFDDVTANVAGSGGADMATLYDSSGDDTLNAGETQAVLDYNASGAPDPNVTVVGFPDVSVYALFGGDDTATLTGSSGNDRFTGRETYGRMKGNSSAFINFAKGFDTLTGDVSGTTGLDIAILYDAATDDDLVADDTSAYFDYAATGVSDPNVTAQGFDQTYSYATSGGHDTSVMYGSVGVDRFTAKEIYSNLKGNSGAYFHYGTGFDESFADVTIGGGGGVDLAFIYDASTDDLFTAGPTQATIDYDQAGSPGINVTATGFDEAYAYADNGGTDAAVLNASAGADKFYGLTPYSYLKANDNSFYNYARGFDTILANAVGSGDLAFMYGSDGDDVLNAGESSAAFTTHPTAGTPVVSTAAAFDQVYTYASGGGTDQAYLNGTTGPDTFVGDLDWGYLRSTGTGNYFNYVRYFDEVYADPGDTDIGNDTLDDRGATYTLDTTPPSGNDW
jgi:parallel beta-helix repeat protein